MLSINLKMQDDGAVPSPQPQFLSSSVVSNSDNSSFLVTNGRGACQDLYALAPCYGVPKETP